MGSPGTGRRPTPARSAEGEANSASFPCVDKTDSVRMLLSSCHSTEVHSGACSSPAIHKFLHMFHMAEGRRACCSGTDSASKAAAF